MKINIITLFIILCGFTYGQEMLPNIELKTLSNSTISTQKIASENELIIISLWATWCVPCKNELDAVSDLYQDWIDETNVIYYAVSIDDSRTSNRIKPMINGKDWDFEILLDQNSDLKRAFGISTVPYTVIVKDQKVVYKHTGYTPGYEEELYSELLKYSN